MIMKIKKTLMLSFILAATLSLSACAEADVIGKTAVTSFEALIDKLGDKVAFDEAKNYWSLVSPTGETFEWGKDFSSTPDAIITFDAAPFIAAGLTIENLPAEQYQYDEASGKLLMPFELSQDAFEYTDSDTALDTFKQIVKTNRESIGYHADMDHYGISLGNGNMFEWAKDMDKNDKDIVFVLNPQPFIDAGADLAKVDGWAFAKVKTTDHQGKMVEVDKLLKPFELN
jgi:hypothetical protein